MPDRPQSIPIDLSRPTGATRRQIYDAVVAVHFTPAPGEVLAAKEAGEWYPKHSADDCGVAVARVRPTTRGHFCSNCSNWPTSDYDTHPGKPTDGELCNECKSKRASGNCS